MTALELISDLMVFDLCSYLLNSGFLIVLDIFKLFGVFPVRIQKLGEDRTDQHVEMDILTDDALAGVNQVV